MEFENYCFIFYGMLIIILYVIAFSEWWVRILEYATGVGTKDTSSSIVVDVHSVPIGFRNFCG